MADNAKEVKKSKIRSFLHWIKENADTTEKKILVWVTI